VANVPRETPTLQQMFHVEH